MANDAISIRRKPQKSNEEQVAKSQCIGPMMQGAQVFFCVNYLWSLKIGAVNDRCLNYKF